MKADDDTFVIADNLRDYLKKYDTEQPILIGSRYKGHHMHGGAGYILSRQALRLFGEKAVLTPQFCLLTGRDEDVHISQCLQKLGIKFISAFDDYGIPTFQQIQTPLRLDHAHYKKRLLGYPKAYGPLSKHAITWHRCAPEDMYMYDYFLYDLEVKREHSGRADSNANC